MKKLLVIFLAVVTLLSCSANALALGETENINDEIDLCYLYTNGVTSLISIKSKKATCTSKVIGLSGITTKIVITQRLQKKNGDSWSNVKSWTKTYNQASAVYVNKKGSLASGTYRTRTIAKVYKGSAYETIKVNSSTTTC